MTYRGFVACVMMVAAACSALGMVATTFRGDAPLPTAMPVCFVLAMGFSALLRDDRRTARPG